MTFKKFLILVIVITFRQSVFSQALIDGTSVWNYYSSDINSTPRPTNYSYYRTISIDGDTTIQSQTYYKRYTQGIDSVWNHTVPSLTVTAHPKTFLDYLRADAGHFYAYIDGRDSMVFDFMKGVGDTVQGFLDNSCRGTITHFDTLYLGSTVLRRANLNFTGVHDYIHGIGTTRGHSPTSFANCVFIGNPWYRLTCYRRQNETLVLEPGRPCITFSSTDEIESASMRVDIYPNPTADYLRINHALSTPVTLVLYNLQGQILRSRVVQRSTTMDVRDLPKGIYVLHCTANNKSMVHRFVKQ